MATPESVRRDLSEGGNTRAAQTEQRRKLAARALELRAKGVAWPVIGKLLGMRPENIRKAIPAFFPDAQITVRERDLAHCADKRPANPRPRVLPYVAPRARAGERGL
jgi:hypothetical protein